MLLLQTTSAQVAVMISDKSIQKWLYLPDSTPGAANAFFRKSSDRIRLALYSVQVTKHIYRQTRHN